MTHPDFTILIATKDRPDSLRKLLRSVAQSTIKPKSLIVISSGRPINEVIAEFKEALDIDYFHSEVTGQVNQKKIGITRVRKEIPWVLFLDDDLFLAPNAVEKAFETLAKYHNLDDSIVGIGLGLTPTGRIRKSSQIQNLMGRALRLSSGNPGSVIRSGQGVSYLESPYPIYTQWLNGASIWRTKCVLDYIKMVPSSSYAACEDLVFSYQQSKKGKLIFAPDAKVFFQETESNDYNRSQSIISSAAWRYFFVKSNPELSMWQLIYSQVGRLVYILITEPRNEAAIRAGLWSVGQLLISILSGKDSMYLINKIT